jgi:hypothetical protein
VQLFTIEKLTASIQSLILIIVLKFLFLFDKSSKNAALKFLARIDEKLNSQSGLPKKLTKIRFLRTGIKLILNELLFVRHDLRRAYAMNLLAARGNLTKIR